MGSSRQMSSDNEPLTSLYFHTKNSKGRIQSLHMEMTTQEIENAISLLQKAKESLQK